MARGLTCCLGALCVAAVVHVARAGNDGLVFGVCESYDAFSEEFVDEKATLKLKSLPNATAHKLTLFHHATVDVRARITDQELHVRVLGHTLLFPPAAYATSTVIVTDTTIAMKHVGEEVYDISDIIRTDGDNLTEIDVYGHYVALDFVILEQKTADADVWQKVAWWDFYNETTFDPPASRPSPISIRISTHDATTNSTTFADTTDVHPQWLMSDEKHLLRVNDYSGEGNYYAESLGREEFDEDMRTCRLYTQTFRESEISFGCLHGYGRPAGGGSCTQCSHGKYANQETKSQCRPCDPRKGTLTLGSKECVQCPVGKFLDNTQSGMCASCVAGKYRDEAVRNEDIQSTGTPYEERCENCPVGKYNENPESVSEQNCTKCTAGKYSDAIGNATSATCRACDTGTYAEAGSSVCQDCLANRTTLSEQSSLSSCVCEQGFFLVDNVTCSACSVGKFNNKLNQTECRNCSAGFFQGGTNATACNACDLKQYADEGSAVCTPCPGNATTQGQQAVRSDCLCDPGYFGPNGSECGACAAGKYTGTYGNADCTNCSAGLFQNQTAQSACSRCASGLFSDSGKTVCEDCPDYSGLDVQNEQNWQGNIGDCQCMPGYFNNQTREKTQYPNQDCTACSVGMYKERFGNQSCDVCPVGTFQNRTARSNQTACKQCQLTEYAPEGANQCISCPDHTTARWKHPDKTDCHCNRGYTGPDGDECKECVAGKYKASQGSAACSECDGGTASNVTAAVAESTCQPCTNEQYAAAGSATCQSCPPDAQSVEPRNVRETCRCNAGSHGLNGGACSACPSGTYKQRAGSHPCTQCASGKYSNTQQQDTEDTCRECQAHEFAPPGSSACSACPSHTETWSPRATEGDCKCRRGFNGTRDGAACDPCQPGTFKHRVGAGECVLCPPGTFSAAANASSAAACEPCATGTYSATGATICERCYENSESDAASGDASSCLCKPGYTLDVNKTECTLCGENKVKKLRGNGACSAIPAHSGIVQGTQTWQCNAGYTLGTFEVCKACPRGQYKAGPGNHACVACAAPRTTAAAASTSASACVDTVPVDGDGDGVLNRAELAELESRTHLHLTGLEGTANVTTGMVAQLADDVVFELAGDFDKGEVFYQYQSAGDEDSTFAVDNDLVLDAMSAKGVEIVDMEVFDTNHDDLTDSGEWNRIKRALGNVSVLARQGKAEEETVSSGVGGEDSGVAGSLVVIFAVVFVVLVAIALLRRSLSGSGRRR
jgi:hypothetical protein